MDNDKPKLSAQQMQFVMQMINYYDKNGQDKLVQDIFSNVANQKKQGKLTNEQISQFVKNVSPLLNAQQKQKLDDLVKDLLKIWFFTKFANKNCFLQKNNYFLF